MASTGLVYWIKRAESDIRTNSLSQLIEITENLFYTLYSRVILEMAGIEIFAQFKMESRPLTNRHQLYLPDPDHMYRIFLTIKDVLDSSAICEDVNEAVVHAFQEGYIRRILRKENDKGFNIDDMLGYRRFAVSVVNDKTNQFTKKWNLLIPFFDSVPAALMALISEKYFAIVPKVVLEDDILTSELPFIDIKSADYGLWEKEIIKDHRMAALAKLEGKSLGDVRSKEANHLLHQVKQHKCICTSLCCCAHECTNDPERFCPCSERQLRVMLAQTRKGPGRFNFTTRANTMGRACFEGLTVLKRDIRENDLLLQLRGTIELFEMEITKERLPTMSNVAWIEG